MKKYFISILAAAVAFAGCINFEESLPIAVEEGGSSEIVFSDVADDSFVATISAPAGSGFYSYAVVPSSKVPTAASVFKVKVGTSVECFVLDEEGKPALDEEGEFIYAAAEGTACYADQKQVVVSCAKLAAATSYTVYVVTASEQGTTGPLVKASVTTTDNSLPKVKSCDRSEADSTAITLIFDDQIQLAGDGTGAVAHFFGVNKYDSKGNLQELGMEAISKDSVKVSGNKLRLAATVKQPGLLTIFTLPAGFVKNTTGLVNEASAPAGAVLSEHAKIKSFSDANGYTLAKGKAWDFIPYGEDEDGYMVSLLVDDEDADDPAKAPKVIADTTYKFTDWTKFEMYAVPENSIAYKNVDITILTIESSGRTVTYPVYDCAYYGMGATGIIGVSLEEAPTYGSTVYYSIAEGSFEDVFGNPNNEFSILMDKDEDGNFKYATYFYSYGYNMLDVVGTYMNQGESGYGSSYNETAWSMTIAESDNAEKGNVMLTSYYDFNCKIYADFDFDMGTLTFPIEKSPLEFVNIQGYYYDFYTFAYYSTAQGAKTPLVLYMTEAGAFTDGNDYPGYYYDVYADEAKTQKLGYDYNIFYPEFQRITNSAAFASAAKTQISGTGLNGKVAFDRVLVKK